MSDESNVEHLMPAPAVIEWMRENSADDISGLSDEELVARWTTDAPPPRTATQQLLAGYRRQISDEAESPRLVTWYRVAKELGVKNQRVYYWKEGRGAMPDDVVARICKRLYDDKGGMNKRWLCEVAAERATRSNDEHNAKLWREMAKRFLGLAFPLLLWFPTDAEALASAAERNVDDAAINIMLNRIRQWIRAQIVSLLRRRDLGPPPAASIL